MPARVAIETAVHGDAEARRHDNAIATGLVQIAQAIEVAMPRGEVHRGHAHAPAVCHGVAENVQVPILRCFPTHKGIVRETLFLGVAQDVEVSNSSSIIAIAAPLCAVLVCIAQAVDMAMRSGHLTHGVVPWAAVLVSIAQTRHVAPLGGLGEACAVAPTVQSRLSESCQAGDVARACRHPVGRGVGIRLVGRPTVDSAQRATQSGRVVNDSIPPPAHADRTLAQVDTG